MMLYPAVGYPGLYWPVQNAGGVSSIHVEDVTSAGLTVTDVTDSGLQITDVTSEGLQVTDVTSI